MTGRRVYLVQIFKFVLDSFKRPQHIVSRRGSESWRFSSEVWQGCNYLWENRKYVEEGSNARNFRQNYGHDTNLMITKNFIIYLLKSEKNYVEMSREKTREGVNI